RLQGQCEKMKRQYEGMRDAVRAKEEEIGALKSQIGTLKSQMQDEVEKRLAQETSAREEINSLMTSYQYLEDGFLHPEEVYEASVPAGHAGWPSESPKEKVTHPSMAERHKLEDRIARLSAHIAELEEALATQSKHYEEELEERRALQSKYDSASQALQESRVRQEKLDGELASITTEREKDELVLAEACRRARKARDETERLRQENNELLILEEQAQRLLDCNVTLSRDNEGLSREVERLSERESGLIELFTTLAKKYGGFGAGICTKKAVADQLDKLLERLSDAGDSGIEDCTDDEYVEGAVV
ncbi:MAG: hypothetical protein OXF02_07335, partial [Simkaniaceae bacterium]|nr:hypothetical protein [Simkaniaceae bacterium]